MQTLNICIHFSGFNDSFNGHLIITELHDIGGWPWTASTKTNHSLSLFPKSQAVWPAFQQIEIDFWKLD